MNPLLSGTKTLMNGAEIDSKNAPRTKLSKSTDFRLKSRCNNIFGGVFSFALSLFSKFSTVWRMTNGKSRSWQILRLLELVDCPLRTASNINIWARPLPNI